MRVGWREVLGLLVGVALCYGVISYAMVYASKNREVASEQTQETTQGGETGQQTTGASEDGTKTVNIRVTGASGRQFGANYGTLRSGRSVEGVVPADYEVQVLTDPLAGDYVYATAWKLTGDRRELKVQIVEGGKVVKEGSTTEDYGAASVRWSPNEPAAPGGSTTPGPGKAKQNKSPEP